MTYLKIMEEAGSTKLKREIGVPNVTPTPVVSHAGFHCFLLGPWNC